MAPPSWAPTLDRVANYVPGRTLVGAVDGYGNAINIFDASTHPTGQQVTALIADACAWVMLKTGPIDPSLTDAATAVAAVATAAAIERTWPDNSKETQIATELWAQAVSMRDDLWRANEAKTGKDPEDPLAQLMPVYSFPIASQIAPWGDVTFD
jgi:hypothetical protein